MILHGWAEGRCRTILQKCWAALPSGGQLIIAEVLVNDERTGLPAPALMSRNYTPTEYRAWLGDVDCQDIRTVWFEAAGANGAVIGRKPRGQASRDAEDRAGPRRVTGIETFRSRQWPGIALSGGYSSVAASQTRAGRLPDAGCS
jgi:hypothetical protein